jgi:hypothetical protein
MTDQTVADVLNKAADLIEERGWATAGVWVGFPCSATDPEPGEEFYQYGYELAESPAYKTVVAYLGLNDNPWTWNDAPDRTADEVIEALRAAAIIAAAQEVDVRVVAPEAELTPVSLSAVS